MKEFLRQVAEHWFYQRSMDGTCFIFPNKRSMAFFRKYLSETVRENGKGPLRAPRMMAMNDLFYSLSGMNRSGRVSLLVELYHCYSELHASPEQLDDFIYWGDVLLSDFDDVDKYLVDASSLFTNVSDFKSLQDSYEYLSDVQRDAIERFIGHFRSDSNAGHERTDKSVKDKFRQIWDILPALYKSFNSTLDSKGMCYEGKVYRSLAERLSTEPVSDILSASFPCTESFVFVGLNALNECEKRLMSRMRDAGLASFCWDWSDGWISDPQNKSTVFMNENLSSFPQAFEPEGDMPENIEINVLSVPSSVGQAKQLPQILERIADAEYCGDMSMLGIETAVILPDENLLVPVMNSLPQEIEDINVTMGYPMCSSGFFSLMSEICTMQMHLRNKNGGWFFYHKQVHAIFSNGIFKTVAGPEAAEAMKAVKSASQYYIPQDSFRDDPVMKAVFRPVVLDPKLADADIVRSLADYLCDITSILAARLKDMPEMSSELGFAMEYYLTVKRLKSENLPILPATYFHLLSQIFGQCAVPFEGEPLKGLQIMGPLETRTLDFRNLLILSVNEGVFPRRSVSSSFIPPELRKGFGLPTYEYQDAVWAYYFYRLLIRAEKVWMLCDSRTEGLKSGEESRYIKQLELHFGARVNRMVAKAPAVKGEESDRVEKTAEDVRIIRETHLSASALQNYLYCPAKFYYHTVKKLKSEEEVSESLDAGMIGNVFHNTMCALYLGGFAMDPSFVIDRDSLARTADKGLKSVSRDHIRTWLSRPDAIKARIRSLIMQELHSFEVTGRNIVFAEVIYEYVVKVLERDLERLQESGRDSFEILGLELKRTWSHDGFNFIGYIDRVDSFVPGEYRVVDYKTGKVEDAEININAGNASDVVSKLFGDSNDRRPKIALQLFLYDMLVGDSIPEGALLKNSIYSPSRLFVSGIEESYRCDEFVELMKSKLSELLLEISDTNIPFARTSDKDVCGYCDFRKICGR